MPNPLLETTGFDPAGVVPPEVAEAVWSEVVTGAPFANSLVRLPTSSSAVVLPVVAPTGANWTAEGAEIPDITPGDKSILVNVSKLAGVLEVSNELSQDNPTVFGQLVGNALVDSISPKLDNGILYGDGTAPNPQGLLDAGVTPAAPGDNLRAAIIEAWGELGDAGADPVAIKAFVKPSVAAFEFARELTGSVVHPDTANTGTVYFGPGIQVIPVPGLDADDVLVADATRLYLVLRDDFRVDMSEDAAFTRDNLVIRVKGRFAVAAPTPDKSLRTATFPSGS